MKKDEFKKYKVKLFEKNLLEPEEIFLDAQARTPESKLQLPLKNKEFKFLFKIIFASLCLLLIRAGWLQIVKGNDFAQKAQLNRIRTIYTKTSRGLIFSKDLKPLVYNIPSYDLVIIPRELSRQKEALKEEILNLARLTDNTYEDLIENFREIDFGSSEAVLLQENISRDIALIIETKLDLLPGVKIQKNITRLYLEGEIFSHILGYTGIVNKEDLKAHPDYLSTDYIGKGGLELTYEPYLRGVHAAEIQEIDARGNVKKIISRQDGLPGQNLVLCLDKVLQEKIFEVLTKHLAQKKLTRAAAVAIDPRDGGILALVSLPTFDNNLFAQGISFGEYQELIENPDKPLFNRTIGGMGYPPGSAIKPLIALAALEEGVLKPSTVIDCHGEISVPHKYNPNIIQYFRDWKAHGPTGLIKAIAESCNVFFYHIGGGYKDFEGLGAKRLAEYLGLFGLGEKLGIDLGGEAKGLVPTPRWKEEVKQEPWVLGDTYHLSIGQGDILTTPLQVALYTAAIANGGTLFKPRLVDKVMDSQKNIIEDFESQVIRQNFITPANIELIQKGMRAAVEWGSARAMSALLPEIAGKTGTAQYGSQGKTHAWFTSFAPYDNPEIVLVILVEGGGEGTETAVPIAKEIFEWYFAK